MKKRIVMLVVLSVASGLFIIGGRRKKSFTITNDTEESARVGYKRGEKKTSVLLEPGEQLTVGPVFLRIHVSSHSGWFEINLAAVMRRTFNLTEIINAATKEKLGAHAYLTRKGEIDGLKVFYEEIVP